MGLPRNSQMPHPDTVLNEIYPKQEEEGEVGSDPRCVPADSEKSKVEKERAVGLDKTPEQPS